MKTVRRSQKSVRLVDQDVQLLGELHTALPQHATEADILAEATHLGLLLLAAEAATTGQPVESIPALQLSQRLRTRLLPALELLAQHGSLPALLTQNVSNILLTANAPMIASPTHQPVHVEVPAINVQAGADVRSLGGGFLDDDDE